MLSPREMEMLHNGALTVLEDTGMWVDAQDARDYLRAAGCSVNDSAKIVRFPRSVVEAAVATMRAKYADDSAGDVWARVRYSRVFFTNMPYRLHRDFTANAGGFPPFILDLEGRHRSSTLQDVIDSIRLADALENIDMMGLPCSAQDVPHAERPIRMTAELLKRTKKIGGIEAWNKRDIHAIARMGDVITGSREQSLKTPVVMGYAETRSPLCLDANMSDIFIEYAKLGFPQSMDTMPCAATTAPASSAGTVVVGLAESLACVVLGFAVNPSVRMSVTINPSLADMKTMVFPYASPDRMALMAGWTQMLHQFYGCPTGIHAGKTDACVPNAQAGFEKALSTFVPILFGAIGIGTLGQVNVAGITWSPVQLVIDNEIVGYVRRILRGFDVNETTLALDVIKEIGPGGNYLSHPHTAANFRKEFYLSEIVERLPYSAWELEEFKGIEARAAEKARKILASHDPRPLTRDQERAIDEIVKESLSSK
jgi:trimethylamine--corrinoid protein Co-methyltransferase